MHARVDVARVGHVDETGNARCNYFGLLIARLVVGLDTTTRHAVPLEWHSAAIGDPLDIVGSAEIVRRRRQLPFGDGGNTLNMIELSASDTTCRGIRAFRLTTTATIASTRVALRSTTTIQSSTLSGLCIRFAFFPSTTIILNSSCVCVCEEAWRAKRSVSYGIVKFCSLCGCIN